MTRVTQRIAAWLRQFATWLDPPVYIPTRQVLVAKPSAAKER